MLLDVSEALIPAGSPVSFLPGDEGQFGSQAEMRVWRTEEKTSTARKMYNSNSAGLNAY